MNSKLVVLFALAMLTCGVSNASPSRLPASEASAAPGSDFNDPNNAYSAMGETYAQEKTNKDCPRRRGGTTSSVIAVGGTGAAATARVGSQTTNTSY